MDGSQDRPGAPIGLDGMLADLARLAEGRERVGLGELLDVLGARGHGPIFLVLAALMMLPTGMLPFMPTIIGALMILTALEMVAGGKGVSLPKRLAAVGLPGARLRSGIARAAPICRRIGRLLHPRWPALVQSDLALYSVAGILIVASAAMILIGAIPGLPFVLCIPALLFGLGLTAGDGLVVGLGFLACLAVAVGLWALL